MSLAFYYKLPSFLFGSKQSLRNKIHLTGVLVTLLHTHQNGYNEENARVGWGVGTQNSPRRPASENVSWRSGHRGIGGPDGVRVNVPITAARSSAAAGGRPLRSTVGTPIVKRSCKGLLHSYESE